MTEGKPIWVESLLSEQEYKECAKKYPNTYTKGNTKIEMFEGEMKWRYGIGTSLSKIEISTINERLDSVLKKAGVYKLKYPVKPLTQDFSL